MVRRSRLKTENNRKRRLRGLLLLLTLLLLVVAVFVVYRAQLVNLVDIWQETFPAERSVTKGNRGKIYDRNFKELARTLERVSIYVRPREVKDISRTARVLAEELELPEEESIAKMGRDSQLVWLRRDIGQDEEDIVADLALPGIYLHRELARDYPQKEFASQLIGYSENNAGLAGVEHYYNRLLNQELVRQEDFPGIDLKGLSHTGGEGHDLVLTLDMKIQRSLEGYVKELGAGKKGRRVTSLLLDTLLGKIVAGASYPSYDPNRTWQQGTQNLESLLLTPMVIPDTVRRFFRDASLLQSSWEQSTQAYPWSLVSGTVHMGSQLRLWERLQLSSDIQVDFSGGKNQVRTLPRFLATKPPLDFGAVPRTASPLNILQGVAGLLNGGRKIQPHILGRVLEHPGLAEYFYKAQGTGSDGLRVYPGLASREMQSLFQRQGRSGVLGSAMLSGEVVSLVENDSGASYIRDHLALVALPAKSPQMILLLVVRDEELSVEKKGDPQHIFSKQGLDAILPSMVALQQVHRNLADMVEPVEREDQNFRAREEQVKERATKKEGKQIAILEAMPDLVGFSLRKSLRLLQGSCFKVVVQGSGRVVSQIPKAGAMINRGDTCELLLGSHLESGNAVQFQDVKDKEFDP